MKKGFTLIELLAVILILGIIALIAIPTINNILSEAREGAFRTSVDNIVDSLKTKCQSSLIKSESPDLLYTFNDGKSNIPIDIKGQLPDNGYIILDKDCELSALEVSNKNFEYTDAKFIIDDQMIKSYQNVGTGSKVSIFSVLYSAYFSNINEVKVIDNLNIHGNAIEIKDISVSNNGKVKSWLVPNNTKYTLYIGSLNPIYANYDSSYLFASMAIEKMELNNLFTNFTTNMSSMFSGMSKISTLNLEHFYTSNVTDMNSIFAGQSIVESIYISSWDTKNVTNFSKMFNGNQLLKTLDISKWDTKSLTTTQNMFCFCKKIQYLDLSNWNTSNLTNVYGMFDCCNNLVTLKLTNWDVSKVTTFRQFLKDCGWLNTLILPKNMDVSSSNSFMKMFWNIPSLNSIDFSNWKIKSTADLTNFFYMPTNLKEVKFINASDETIIIIASLLPSGNNGIIYVDELKATYPAVTGWTYQEI